jgi:hypothetical protein
MIVLYYTLFCLFCLFTYCLASKKGDDQDVSIGMFVGFVGLSVLPGFNVLAMIFCLIYTAEMTGFWSKKLF